MSTTTRSDKTAAEQLANEHTHLERRTVRAVRECMVVDAYAHPDGSGRFDVYSGSGRRYTVDLRADSCTCPDVEHNDPAGGCKHARRVRFVLGIEAVPAVLLNERDGTLVANMEKFGSEPSIEDRAAQVVLVSDAKNAGRAVADGGTIEDTDNEKPYTVHVEPAAQGGAEFARCTGCEREIVPVRRFEYLEHAEDCPNGSGGR